MRARKLHSEMFKYLKEFQVSKMTREPSTKVSARRRLIRGAFAAPAALTLYNGSAHAAASVTCVVKQVNFPEYPVANTVTDTFIRVRLWVLTLGTKITTWVSGADLALLQAVGTAVPYLSGTQWQCITSAGGSAFTVGSTIGTTPTEGLGSTFLQNGAYVAMRVDATGKIVGISQVNTPNNTTGNSAVHQSCWTSFKLRTP